MIGTIGDSLLPWPHMSDYAKRRMELWAMRYPKVEVRRRTRGTGVVK